MITIIAMTWKEIMRKRVLLLTMLMTIIFLAGYWYVSKTIGADGNPSNAEQGSIEYLIEHFKNGTVILSLGFFFGTFVIAFLSIFSSFSVIAGEAEQGVMQALLPRPIPRWKWYLGRWIGYVSLGLVYAAILFSAMIGIADLYAGVPRDPIVLLTAYGLFAWLVPMLVSVSMLGSCYLPAFGNGVFMIMLYGAGSLGGMLDKVTNLGLLTEETKHSLEMVSGLASLIMPADTLQRRMMAELFSIGEMQPFIDMNHLGPFAFSSIPSNAFVLYSVVYTVVALIWGIRAFQKKNV